MIKARSVLFSIGYALLTFVISVSVILVFWLLPPLKRFYLYSVWCKLVLWWLRITCGVSYRVEGLENIPAYPVVVMSNHQSAWETIFLYQLFTPACPILKKELLDIPFWGWAMRLQNPIAIDRSKPREAGRSLLTQGAQRIKQGLSILVFPEGTRAAAGTLGKFSRGGAQLAVATSTPALPVLHNAGLFWPAGTQLKTPGTILVVIGKPLHPDGKSAKELAAEFEEWVAANKHFVGIA
ncbi:MAG: lysophospholipid acyltransferase family protein [Pseudohongiella sp.]|jgi:1-acyl-sn-glycerol-3-phosphate acyltransferase|nr:lysophospholipid acyltransferase family protein [Pseudohongiella sp.]